MSHATSSDTSLIDIAGGPAVPRYLALDLVRIAAAAMVVIFHFYACMTSGQQHLLPQYAAGVNLGRGAVSLTFWGWVGVQIFFVLSGAVIASSATHGSVRRFVVGRVLRLAPAGWLCATITLLVVGIGENDWLWASWARTVAFIPQVRPIDPVYWTLALECVFYAFVAIATALRVPMRQIGIALGLWSLAFWTLATCGVLPLVDIFVVQTALSWHGIYFALGIAQWEQWTRPPGVLGWLWIALLGLVAWLEVGVATNVYGRAPGSHADLAPRAVLAVAIILIAFAPQCQAWLARRCGTIIPLLAALTYPLYLVHQIVGLVLLTALVRAGLPVEAARIVSLTTVVVIAWLIMRHAEPAVRAALAASISRCHAPAPNRRATASRPAG